MWQLMLVDGLFAFAVVLIPGYVVFRMAGMGKGASLSFAPLASLFILTLVAFCLRYSGIYADWRTVLVSMVLVTAALSLLAFMLAKKSPLSFDVDIKLVLAACLVSAAAAVAYYVFPLDSAFSFYQENDNIAHLSCVREFLETGAYCYGSITRYPALWRTYAAVVASFGAGEVTVAANAVNLVLIAYVYPAAMVSFVEVALPEHKRAKVFACLLVSAFAVFPWGLLLFGPLYPNVIGNALLPLAMTAFVLAIRANSLKGASGWCALFVLSCFVLFYAHPNALFTGVVVLSPLCVETIWDRTANSGMSDLRRKLYCVAFSLFVLVVWVGLYKLPLLSGVVSFDWPAYTTVSQSLVNVLTLGLTKASAPQYVLGLIVLVGISVALKAKGSWWVVATYCLLILIYVADVAIGGRLQHFLAGFWYSDSFRVASSFVYILVPLAGLGCDKIFNVASRCRSVLEDDNDERATPGFPVLAACILLVIVFYPNFALPKNFNVTTGFGMVDGMISSGNSLAENYNGLDVEEVKFVREVHELVGDEPILNYPYDGSAYAYAIDGLNVVNRGWYRSGNANIALLGEEADALASSSEVEEAYKAVGIRYVLLLDIDRDNGGIYHAGGYSQENWVGLEKLNDDTPGYRIVLSRDDMRLYEID